MCENYVSEGMSKRARISSVLMPIERINILISEIRNVSTARISDTYLEIRPSDSRDRIATRRSQKKIVFRRIVPKTLFQDEQHRAT